MGVRGPTADSRLGTGGHAHTPCPGGPICGGHAGERRAGRWPTPARSVPCYRAHITTPDTAFGCASAAAHTHPSAQLVLSGRRAGADVRSAARPGRTGVGRGAGCGVGRGDLIVIPRFPEVAERDRLHRAIHRAPRHATRRRHRRPRQIASACSQSACTRPSPRSRAEAVSACGLCAASHPVHRPGRTLAPGHRYAQPMVFLVRAPDRFLYPTETISTCSQL